MRNTTHVKVGHAHIALSTFASYVAAVITVNQRAANFAERAHIAQQLAGAAMPADILGKMTVYEIAELPQALADQVVRAISVRLTLISVAEAAPL
jgi:hypothetical protein